ncbi:MAG: chemoreceptor glutamine deamidase CheD [Desulfomonilia bacterium]|nr:chemoreceptor glutamine deamidase CheD [Desulfomonilia bacterium]
MLARFSTAFNRKIVVIYPGEFYVSSTDILATVLGSCISVCIRDKKHGIGGLNHFMLPGDTRCIDLFISPSAKYGMFAMELLINELLKKGCSKKHFEAKVFGGGHVINFRKSWDNVPESNIDFIMSFLKMEQIPLVNYDVGGYSGRKILFFPDSGRVLLKKLPSRVDARIIQEEESYRKRISREKDVLQTLGGDLTLFERS